jgi:hypothetical protein
MMPLFASVAFVAVTAGPSEVRDAPSPPASPKTKQVRLAVDYGDGVKKEFYAIPWRQEMTILDAMEFAQKHPRGIKFRMRGRTATAFLTTIDDVSNQGGGAANWTYRVNGQLGDRSFAVYQLGPEDAVVWRFGTE